MDASKITGHLIVVNAPTGSGKGSLITHVREKFPQVTKKISCTTRNPRPGEVDGVDYFFMTRETFESKVAEHAFIEWAEYGGNLYGTLVSELEERLSRGEIVLAELEIQGVEQLKKVFPKEHMTIIYIEAGDWESAQKRILNRAPMTEEQLEKRHGRFMTEQAGKGNADIIIQNQDGMLEEAKIVFEEIIKDIIDKETHG